MLPNIDPILPVLSKTVPTGREWLYEPKLDGFRGMLYLDNGIGSFLSKSRKPMPRFRELAMHLAVTMPVIDAIFDGEIVVMGENNVDFNALLFTRGEPVYAAFDLLWLNGVDLRLLPLHRRKAQLRKLTRLTSIGYVDAMDDPELFDATGRMDMEGIVAKRRNDAYAGETRWVKVKHAGYTQQEGRWELFERRR
jgi:bifunctional non-homologous end joining protein LigD